MKRNYEEGIADNITFFVGDEVEHTPAYGMRTLFVTGIQLVDTILDHFVKNNCQHIFFGANHSFKPGLNFPDDAEEWDQWESMIKPFLKSDILCSLDIPITHAEAFLESGLAEYDTFIPQIRVPLPYVKQWNYNTMIKIDDKDFKSTNPGVWSHSLHDLLDRKKFTDWSKYTLDTIIE